MIFEKLNRSKGQKLVHKNVINRKMKGISFWYKILRVLQIAPKTPLHKRLCALENVFMEFNRSLFENFLGQKRSLNDLGKVFECKILLSA